MKNVERKGKKRGETKTARKQVVGLVPETAER